MEGLNYLSYSNYDSVKTSPSLANNRGRYIVDTATCPFCVNATVFGEFKVFIRLVDKICSQTNSSEISSS